MKILVWNCQGLASTRAVRALLEIQKREKPDVLFLSETHLGKTKAENLKRRLGCDHLIIHESDGRSGGLLMLWRTDVVVQCMGISQYYIDVIIRDEGDWRLTGIYGEPNWERKDRTWEALRSLDTNMTLPWLALGDINKILYHYEKEGGRARTQRQLQAFHDALADCELVDMGFKGDVFTWRRGKIRERFDRGVTDAQWNSKFPNAGLVNGEMVKSDHRPIIVDTDQLGVQNMMHMSPKRFEARWLKEETVNEVIQSAWARAAAHGHAPTLMTKLNQVHDELHTWDRKILKKPAQQMKKLKRELEKLRRGPMTDDSIAAQKEILLRLELLLEQEEIFWVQRARANWLKHGDRNTNFFHHFATSRKKKNMVRGLVDDQGVKHEDMATMGVMVQEYFTHLFTSEVNEVDDGVLTDVKRKVTNDMNNFLLEPLQERR